MKEKHYAGQERFNIINKERARVRFKFTSIRPAPHELALLIDAIAGASGRVAYKARGYFRGEDRSWYVWLVEEFVRSFHKNSVIYYFLLKIGAGGYEVSISCCLVLYIGMKVGWERVARLHPLWPSVIAYRMRSLFDNALRQYLYWEYFPLVALYYLGGGAQLLAYMLLHFGGGPSTFATSLSSLGSFGFTVFALGMSRVLAREIKGYYTKV